MEWRALVWVAIFAYSLYLMHEPLIRVLNFVVDRATGLRQSPWAGTAALFVMGIPLLVGAAFVYFALFERPFLSRRASTSRTL